MKPKSVCVAQLAALSSSSQPASLPLNLAPAEPPKDGSHYDVAIALSILCVSGQLRQAQLNEVAFVGEPARDCTLRPVKGIINMAEATHQAGYKKLYFTHHKLSQAQLAYDIELVTISNLKELFIVLKGEKHITSTQLLAKYTEKSIDHTETTLLDDIAGQEKAMRSLIIATAGRHNILFNGPLGSGKILLAKSLLGLLLSLSPDKKVA